MTLKKYLPIAIFIGIQACVIQMIDQILLGFVAPEGNFGFGWISFQAWAVYFMAGCSIKNGVRAFIGYAIGMVASAIIIYFGAKFGPTLGFFSFPLVLLVIVPFLLYLDQAPLMFNFVPALFVGAGVFFGCMTYVPNATFTNIFVTESIYCIVGLFFGFITITFRTWYEAKYVNKK